MEAPKINILEAMPVLPPVDRERYNELYHDMSVEGLRQRIVLFEGSDAGAILDNALNVGGWDYELLKNNLNDLPEDTVTAIIASMSTIILELDAQNIQGARAEARSLVALLPRG
jgi:hypothetical protein